MKRIIIIGASSGIGKCTALQFAAAGWQVGIAGRRADALHEIALIHPSSICCGRIDVTAPDAEAALLRLIAMNGGMDVFLNVAGIGNQNASLSPDIESSTIATNVKGFTTMVDAAFRYFRDNHRPGLIAAVTSIAGTRGLGIAASYSASKRYQSTYLDAIAQLAHLQRLGIRVTDIRPGFVDTALLADGHAYPLLLRPERVARSIFGAITRGKRVKIIDWRYAILVFFWRLIPRTIWRILPIRTRR